MINIGFNVLLIHNHRRGLYSADEAASLNKIGKKHGFCVGQPKVTDDTRWHTKVHLKSTERMNEIEKWGSRGHRFTIQGTQNTRPTSKENSRDNFLPNETPTWCNTVQVLFLQIHSTCFGRKRPSSGVFKTSTAATGACVIVAGKSSHLLIRP